MGFSEKVFSTTFEENSAQGTASSKSMSDRFVFWCLRLKLMYLVLMIEPVHLIAGFAGEVYPQTLKGLFIH